MNVQTPVYDSSRRKIQNILDSYSAPFWVKDIIRATSDKDIVDVANWLETLSQLANARVKAEFARAG